MSTRTPPLAMLMRPPLTTFDSSDVSGESLRLKNWYFTIPGGRAWPPAARRGELGVLSEQQLPAAIGIELLEAAVVDRRPLRRRCGRLRGLST